MSIARSLRAFSLVAALALAASLVIAPVAEGSPSDTVRLIVQVDEDAPPSQAELRRNGAASVHAAEYLPSTLIVYAHESRVRSIARTDGVHVVERDVLMSIDHHCVSPDHPRHNNCEEPEEPDPTDPDPTDPGPEPDPDPDPDPTGEITWGLQKIAAPTAWTTTHGSGTAVCVADTGIDANHPDLAGKVTKGRNFASGNANNWGDKNGHGTHVAGTVAASGGLLGVAPGASLYAAKVLGNNGSGWLSDIAAGVRWCADEGAHVVNLSLGGSSGNATLESAMTYAHGKGVVIVASSGNSGASSPGYPAAYPTVIAVGATDVNDVIASWSNRGEEINAPGVAVKSTVPGGGYETWSGTSMAAPHVAGVAALLISANESDVRGTMMSTADQLSGTAIRVNAAKAVGAE